MSFCIQSDQDRLNVHNAAIRAVLEGAVRAHRPLFWDRAGCVRKVPTGVIMNALAQYRWHFPEHYDPHRRVTRIIPDDAGVIFWEQITPSP